MNRIAFYLFYDDDGIVDDYVINKLNELKKSVATIFVVSNSSLNKINRRKLETVADIVYCRENIGFDVWGYKEAMEVYGEDRLNSYDEVILMNYTFYGPIYPFEEMFEWSENAEVDFWGISDHKAMTPNPFTGQGTLPRHIQSHFIAIRKSMFQREEFKVYWKKMPMINTYVDSVLQHESRFTDYFESKGFNYSVYCNSDDYASNYPTFVEVKDTLKNRCPVLKRRLFFHDPLFLDAHCIDLKEALDYIEGSSEYDLNLIWKNIVRSTEPRYLLTNAQHHKVFPDVAEKTIKNNPKIAVVAHIFYTDLANEIKDQISHIPTDFDLFITTSSEKDKEILTNLFHEHNGLLDVRVVEENRGGDMSSLLITCKDVVIDKGYDYICRLHSKTSHPNGKNHSDYFKRHMYGNILNSKGYVTNLINFLQDNEQVGILTPDLVHFGFSTMGHSWFSNKEKAENVALNLGLKIKFDENTPHASYGAMFWFRPNSLLKLFEYDWKWTDFDEESDNVDGSLAHVLELLLVYTALDSGYLGYNVSTMDSISKTYGKLEYKYQKIMSELSNSDIHYQLSQFKLNESIHDDLKSKDNEIQLLKLQYHDHLNSWSWKITGPLRRIRRIICEKLSK